MGDEEELTPREIDEMERRELSLVGEEFGRLLVVKQSLIIKFRGKDKLVNPDNWLCLCSCGQEVEVEGPLLQNGSARICGYMTAANKHQILYKGDLLSFAQLAKKLKVGPKSLSDKSKRVGIHHAIKYYEKRSEIKAQYNDLQECRKYPRDASSGTKRCLSDLKSASNSRKAFSSRSIYKTN